MKLASRLMAGALSLAVLGGCGNDNPGPGPVMAMVGGVAKATVASAKAKKSGKARAPAPVTRADLAKYEKPILRVAVPSRGLDGFLTISDSKGDVVTWTTTDGATFSFRNGVLIQSRGLGPDLMSAQVPTVAELSRDGGRHQRVYYFLGADDQATRRTYECTVKVVGRDTITVFERNHETTQVKEDCTWAYGSIKNDFWIEGTSIRRARQWLSAGTGYVEFEKVID